jgi:Phasin protein
MAIKVTKIRQRSGSTSTSAEESGAATAASPLEQWLTLQADLFRAAEPALLGWIERRCEAGGAALQSLNALAQCRDPNEVAALQSEWLSGALQRFERDFQAASEQMATLTQSVTSVAQRAAQGTQNEMKIGTAWILRRQDPSPTASPVTAAEITTATGPATEAVWQSR